MNAIVGTVLIGLYSAGLAADQPDNTPAWELTTVEQVCEAYPKRVAGMLDKLDLDRKDLAAVKSAIERNDLPAACTALLGHYRQTKKGRAAPTVKPGTGRNAPADAILQDTITCYRIAAKVPRLPNGRLDWSYNGPNNDLEWGWGLNRHYHLRTVLGAYRKTGNPAYIRCLRQHLQDWITANPYPAKRSHTPQWRGLEVHSRLSFWANVFHTLQNDHAFSPATRVLMLTSIPDHAHYQRNFHAGGGNWVTMEMFGLATAAICWPEFKQANHWLDYAIKRTMPEIARQVYPDGVQKELTSHYHMVAMHSFERLADLLRRNGRPIPERFLSGIKQMKNYVAYSIRPDGYGPLNNDSNLDYNRSRVVGAAKAYKRPDWMYIATNGKRGTRPDGPPSVVFPYAGQVIMRSGWDADAHWAFFDVGPLGIGHWHYDKLHLSVSAFGRDLLVDAGRYTYKGGAFRRYFVGSAGHNVILVDGKHQKPEVMAAFEPMSGNHAVTPEFDFARGTFDRGFRDCPGQVVHTRSVLYLRGRYWVVVDRITTDRPRTIQPIWHFGPDCAVAVSGVSVASTDAGKGNLRIVPVSDLDWKVEIVKGRTKPSIQGWYSREYNVKTPSPAVVYSAKIDRSGTLAWILVPAKGPVLHVKAKLLSADESRARLEVTIAGDRTDEITIPMKGNTPKITTK